MLAFLVLAAGGAVLTETRTGAGLAALTPTVEQATVEPTTPATTQNPTTVSPTAAGPATASPTTPAVQEPTADPVVQAERAAVAAPGTALAVLAELECGATSRTW